MSHTKREYDILIWGATGFTGQLVADYLVQSAPKEVRLALGGRNREKLERVKENALSQASDRGREVGILIANSEDQSSLDNVVRQSRIIISTVGPYGLYGYPLVDSCVRLGTDYLDLTGEPLFMKKCIDKHEQTAEKTGALILHAAGYDSIPSDISAFMVVDHIKTQWKGQPGRVRVYHSVQGGGPSGGTLASAFNMASTSSWKELSEMGDPYYLSRKKGKDGPLDGMIPGYSQDIKSWCAPFLMSTVNSKVVQRSSDLLNYTEMMGPLSLFWTLGITGFLLFFSVMILIPPFLWMVKRIAPQPGEGPSKEVINNSSFKALAFGETNEAQPKIVKAVFQGFKDPGYGETSRMISEAALCLALERDRIPGKKGGFHTPASGLGWVLVERLNKAGLKVEIQRDA